MGVAVRDPWPWDELASLVQGLERAGYTAVFLPEITGRDTFAALAALAGETRELRLGTGVVPLPSRAPMLTAMGAATVHERSGGRAIAGLGTGPAVPGALARLEEVVGVLRRLFVFVKGDDGPQAVVNPTVVERADETEPDEEGCLSLQGVKVPVERSVRVVVEGLDANGKPVRHELEDYTARVVQHELDHLDGVLIIDRTDDEHRKDALRILRPRVVLR